MWKKKNEFVTEKKHFVGLKKYQPAKTVKLRAKSVKLRSNLACKPKIVLKLRAKFRFHITSHFECLSKGVNSKLNKTQFLDQI